MKRFAPSLVFVLLLAGCAAGQETDLTLSFSETGNTRAPELLEAAERVATRRLESLGGPARGARALQEGSGAVLRLTVRDPALRETLVRELTSPFSFRLMMQAPREQATLWNDQFGGFAETGITEKDIAWADAGMQDETGFVVISLTEEGLPKLKQVFRENMDKQIGVFVRDRLMSRKLVTEDDAENSVIQIDGIPSPTIASIFADDVVVGTHVTFRPLPVEEQP
ncbi:MAG: hypothetical protein PHW10_02990 [Candidatus Peribacteraceae bacterium]|nr:hypothetical protein [Candidatus Peribacteraceae bacterium]